MWQAGVFSAGFTARVPLARFSPPSTENQRRKEPAGVGAGPSTAAAAGAWEFCLAPGFPWIANLQVATETLRAATQPSGSITVIFPILFALHQSTSNSLWHWCSAERFPPRSSSCAVSKPQWLIIPASSADISRWGNDILNEQSWLPGKAILQDSTAN